MDAVFKALADPGRRRLLDMLNERGGQTLAELCEGLDMRRQSVSQHLAQLEAANLISTTREGRLKRHYLNPVPIDTIQRRWIKQFEQPRLAVLAHIKATAEETAMAQVPDYVYTTYIRASPEQVWEALTSAELSAQFWGHAQVSDWNVGSRVDHVRSDGSGVADASGRVVAVDRPRRLTFGFDDPSRLDEPGFTPSEVTFAIEPYEDIVQLTVTHARLASDEERSAIGQGWPAVLSNLKTFLETGAALPTEPWAFHADERASRMAANDQ